MSAHTIGAITPEQYALAFAHAANRDDRIPAYLSHVSPESARAMATAGAQFLAVSGFGPCPAAAYLRADGYFGGLFSLIPGYGSQIVGRAVELGARKLDCLGDDLAGLYARHGFREIFRAPWDDKQAPELWLPEYGKPDYIEMRWSI